MSNYKLQRMVFLGILCAEGIVLGVLEASLPTIFPFAPGAKIGLSNIVTLIALVTLPFGDCILLTILRLVLTALITGGAITFLYAFSGAMLSLIMMKFFMFFYKRKLISLIGVSIVGGVFHNLGQLLIASWIAQTPSIMLYLPILTFMGILSGIAVGLVAKQLLKHIITLDFITKSAKLKGRSL